MHEFSICGALLGQVAAIARDHGARSVTRIRVRVGALSGVEPILLERAFSLARIGTVAEAADLHLSSVPARVDCRACGQASAVPAGRMSCPACGSLDTRVCDGDDLVLDSVDLEVEEAAPSPGVPALT